jgi:hypothetical protein
VLAIAIAPFASLRFARSDAPFHGGRLGPGLETPVAIVAVSARKVINAEILNI